MDEDFEVAQWGPKFHHPKITLALIVLNQIIVWSKNLDQDLSFEWLNIFVGHLEVDFLELWTWAFLPSYRISSFQAMSVDLGMKANIDFFVQRAKKPTLNIPTTMFDPSKDRSWSKFLENTMIVHKNLSSRVVMGCTNLGPKGATSKWKITDNHVQVWRSLCLG